MKGSILFYDIEADQEDLVEFLNAHMRGNTTFVVKENDKSASLVLVK